MTNLKNNTVFVLVEFKKLGYSSLLQTRNSNYLATKNSKLHSYEAKWLEKRPDPSYNTNHHVIEYIIQM